MRTTGGSGVSRTAMRVAMPIVPSLPTKQPRRSKPGWSGSRPPSMRHRAVGEHDVDGEHVRGGDPRRQAVRAAGVGGDVAADGARLLRRRVGRVVQPEVGDRAAEVEVEHPRLHPRAPLLGVDLEHAVEPGGDDHDGVVDGGRAAREAGAAPPGDERPVVARRHPHRVGDLAAGLGEAHDGGAAPRHARVARVERELERLGARPVGAEDRRRSARSARESSITRDYDENVARESLTAASRRRYARPPS